ncbi:3-dehydroquinate synthase [Vagococcus intermedius]|uniref:3-dehydroquinate synthase n=1 Tax=Vagococcus intermedius TaxID=2991418 RepID=A0AAF0CWG7_9ENTE|nr:3-dehydroquinate synthase [Vagococcus intermedius]WEG74156.1 3-dehydroquinate synthase [Vagococcus intermedius]WEG76236.1 3-dehydroquinate synthase [Vagococcus intermedius]
MKEVSVSLNHCSYEITLGRNLLPKIGQWVSKMWKQQKIAIITDQTVAELYLAEVTQSLELSGFDVISYAIVPGESSKSLEMAETIYAWLADHQFTRTDGLIALGGGVVGDLTGFVASTYMRGLHFLQVPTTLLAQVDSSVGGKTAVNTKVAKNLIGTFAQPKGVLIDLETLKSLEARRIREGLAEIIKMAAIMDSELWEYLKKCGTLSEFLANSEEIIGRCCQLKAQVVASDELDQGERLILNFGHTIGHGIEVSSGLNTITHGEAVAMGMVQISQSAEQKGLTQLGTTQQLISLLKQFGLPLSYPKELNQAILQAITHDKKAQGNTIRLIVLKKIGEANIIKVPISEVRTYLI